jgi:hypothetical protein
MKAPRPGDAFHLDLDGTVIAGRRIEVDPPVRMLTERDRQGTDKATPALALIEITFTPTGDGATVAEVRLPGLSAEDAAFYPQLLERYLDQTAAAFAGAEPGALPGNRIRDLTRREQQARREGLARILEGTPLHAEVLWQDTRTRDGLIAQLTEALGLHDPDANDPGLRTWRTSELTIHLRLEEAGDLAAPLAFPGPKPKKKHLHKAIGQRRHQASGHLTATGRQADLTLIEIDHPDDFAPLTDPKFALRLGCADAGRLTQFINTPSGKRKTATRTSIEHRSLQSWTDGFRQLGLSTIPEHSLDGLPADLNVVALWLVKRRADGPTGQRRMTPVAVRTSPSGAITGWDPDTGEWIPYRTLLLRLTRHADVPGEEEAEPDGNEEPGKSKRPWYPDSKEQRAITAQFIKPLLYSLRREQVLLMTHAQNSRGLWPFLVNRNLLRDSLQFGASAAQGIGLYGDGLRHVRVRDHSMNETPQWYGYTPAPDKSNRRGVLPGTVIVTSSSGSSSDSRGTPRFVSTTRHRPSVTDSNHSVSIG